MWDAIASAIKIFAEKHLIPTIIALVFGVGALLILPADHWAIVKVGESRFFGFVAGIVFLIVQLIMAIKTKIQSVHKAKADEQQEREREEEEKIKYTERLISFVERLPADDRKVIMKFIKSGNKPIVEHVYWEYTQRPLYRSDVIVHILREDQSSLIKLEESFYYEIKAIYEERGSITHFDEKQS